MSEQVKKILPLFCLVLLWTLLLQYLKINTPLTIGISIILVIAYTLLITIIRYGPVNKLLKIEDAGERIKAMTAYNESNCKPAIKRFNNRISLAYFQNGDFDEALYYNDLDFKECKSNEKGSSLALAVACNNMCVFSKSAGDYERMSIGLEMLQELYDQRSNKTDRNALIFHDTIITARIKQAIINGDIEGAERLLNDFRTMKHVSDAELLIKLFEAEIELYKNNKENAARMLTEIKEKTDFKPFLLEIEQIEKKL